MQLAAFAESRTGYWSLRLLCSERSRSPPSRRWSALDTGEVSGTDFYHVFHQPQMHLGAEYRQVLQLFTNLGCSTSLSHRHFWLPAQTRWQMAARFVLPAGILPLGARPAQMAGPSQSARRIEVKWPSRWLTRKYWLSHPILCRIIPGPPSPLDCRQTALKDDRHADRFTDAESS